MKRIIFSVLTLLFIFGSSGCFRDLDTIPLDPLDITADILLEDPASYKKFLARVYAGLAVSGQEGPAGQADISGIDEGFGQYLRGFWYHTELSTDEALIAWNDATIQDFHAQTWGAGDGFIFAFYSRIFYQISICNEFLRETTEQRLNDRNITGPVRDEISTYRAEVRFLRALSYWHALDHFRNVPFVTEEDFVGAFFPEQINARDLFDYIESELLSIDERLLPPRTNEYARADQAAAWMLLAKLYLNAEVYIGQPKYTEALQYCERILSAGYTLEPEYAHLFLADNDRSNEIIFPIAFDGNNTRTFGGTTFIINASIGGDRMRPADLGMAGGWAGTRTTREFFNKFPDDAGGLVAARNLGQTAAYPKRYVSGSHQGNDPTTAFSISSTGNNFFEGHEYFPEPNSTIQFTIAPAPQVPRFGDNGPDGVLNINGAPILVPEAGVHFIEVNWSELTYTIEKREYVIRGTATSNNAVPMTYDPETNALKATLDMVAGDFVFATEDGSIAFGDNGGDGILTVGGDPIQKITTAGSYEITFFINQPDYSYQINSRSFDRRPLFFTDGQTVDIDNVLVFSQGIAVNKFKNVTSTGQPGSNASYADTDFPMFRLADAYLMAAEAIMRSGGSTDQALQYVNTVRERAFQGGGGNLTADELTLDELLDERGRELYWECHRRTDLIRFGKFSDSDYLWQWKGGVRDGAPVSSFRDVYPIPSQDLGANPNLTQNEGY